MTGPRIDKLQPGDIAVLDFNGRYEERALFVGIIGEGDERHARFVNADSALPASKERKGYYAWEAYRYNGHWAFGTSAERLRLLEVLS